MADAKSMFIEAIRNTPAGIKDFLKKEIPSFAGISWPTDKDAAILANGQLAANVNLLLQQFSGLTLVELLLRIGQHNVVTQGILLSCLEASQIADDTKVFFLSPKPGGIYYGWFSEWKVRIQGEEKPDKVTCLVNGEEFDLAPGGESGVYVASWPVAIGEWQATATATFATHTGEALAGFSIRHWEDAPTVPEEGGHYTVDDLKQLSLSSGNSTDDVKTVTVSLDDTTVELQKSLAPSLVFTGLIGSLAEKLTTKLAGETEGFLVGLLFSVYQSEEFQARFQREFYVEPSPMA